MRAPQESSLEDLLRTRWIHQAVRAKAQEIYPVLPSWMEEQDVIQDTLLKAWIAQKRTGGKWTSQTLCRKILKHAGVEYLRKRLRRKKSGGVWMERLSWEIPQEDREAERRLTRLFLLSCPRTPLQRKVLERYLEGYTGPEIAQDVQSSPGAVYALMTALRKTIRKETS